MGLPTNTIEVGECGLRCSIRTQLGGNPQPIKPTRWGPVVSDLRSLGWFCVRPEILLLVLIAQD